MSVRQITKPQIAKLTSSLESQGVDVERRKDGLWLRLPNGEQMGIHFTPSDINARKVIFSKLRRAGVVHPDDPRGLTKVPEYITKGTIDKLTRKQLIDWFIKQDFPKEVLAQDVRTALWPKDAPKTNRALWHTGFRPEDRPKGKQKRVWIAPDELLAMAPLPTEELLKQGATHPLVHPTPGTIGERINGQLKDKERERVPNGSHPTKAVNRTPAPAVEAVVIPSPAHKENIQKQGGVVPKAIPKPKRQYTEIERALAAQGKTLDDLEHRVVEAATSGTPGEIVDAQAEHISALKQHAEALAEDLEQTAADEGSLADQLEKANEVNEEQRLRNQELADKITELQREVEAAMGMASEAEAALAEANERATKAEELLSSVKVPFEAPDDSWVVSLKDFLEYNWATVQPRFQMLRTLGLDYEFRVWRKKKEES